MVKEIIDIDKELNIQNNKFSVITKEFKESTQGKPSGKLKTKTHKRLKERLINCFSRNSSEIYLDKSLIRFSLYKLNNDEDIKELMLKNYQLIFTHFDGILF